MSFQAVHLHVLLHSFIKKSVHYQALSLDSSVGGDVWCR